MDREKTCIIVGAGDFTPDEIEIKEGDLCIAVDGGYLYCKMQGIVPDMIVGDFDSVDDITWESILDVREVSPEKVVVLNTKKDDTDTLAALRIAMEKGYRCFRIYGAMGGRLEHTIANIQCLTYLKNNGAKGYIMNANVMMTVIKEETLVFNPDMEGYMSLFSLNEKSEGVSISGMKYPLDKVTLTNDYPIGVSNEFIGEKGCVTVEKGTLLVIVAWG